MVNLEQIRELQSKVHKAVEHLTALQAENKVLRAKLSDYETRIQDLETVIAEFRSEQREIEAGIISALNHLDSLEIVVGGLQNQSESSDRQPHIQAAEHLSNNHVQSADIVDEIESDESENGDNPNQSRQLDIF